MEEFLGRIPEYHASGDVVTPEMLRDLHKKHGLQEMGRTRQLLSTGEASNDPKERKSLTEVKILSPIFSLYRELEKYHPPFALPIRDPDEHLGMPLVRKRAYTPLSFLSPQHTEALRSLCRERADGEIIISNIATMTQQKIVRTVLQLIRRFEVWSPRQYEQYRNDVAMANEGSTLPTEPGLNLAAAGANSNQFMWAVLGVIPAVFLKYFGKEPTAQEAAEIANNSDQFVEMMATCHFEVFKSLQSRLRRPENMRSPLFDPVVFYMRKHRDKIMLALRAVVLKDLPVNAERKSKRVMCSALHTEDWDGQNLVQFLYGSNRKLAKSLLYPFVCREG